MEYLLIPGLWILVLNLKSPIAKSYKELHDGSCYTLIFFVPIMLQSQHHYYKFTKRRLIVINLKLLIFNIKIYEITSHA